VRLILAVGPQTAIAYARRLGITSPLQNVYSLALGTSEVTLLELTSAYATWGAGGVRSEPYAIERVLDHEGHLLERREPRREEVLSPQTSFLITSMLQTVIEDGTGRGARRAGFKEPAAGKTGTTDDYTDGWFVGYTTELAVGVWTGFDEKRSMGPLMTGARVALPTWTSVMKAYYRDHSGEPFPEPPGIVHKIVCEETGLLASTRCPKAREEVFREGTEPRQVCDRHGFGGETWPARETGSEGTLWDGTIDRLR
jgi:penicillin-binding protein 1A